MLSGSAGLSASARPASGRGFTGTEESREAKIIKGKRRIQLLASALQVSHYFQSFIVYYIVIHMYVKSIQLHSHHADAAVRLFRLAVQHNFTAGRRSVEVVAACLYTVCRREKTPHLLLDFSDLLQVNVFILGSVFMKLVRLLNLNMPLIDPSIFIPRYAAQLEFGDKTHLVTMTAIRLVHRMKRDWIQV
jgi:transcription factor IIIB subunit 2